MTITRTLRALRDALHLLVGMPSYETYRAHMAEAHPDRPVMSESAFFRDRQQARYGGRNGGRCC
ncbi:YbdD/YjiX family protein [Sphingomonas sp. DC1100-1]|uniref:YbdD/YjiX family protein n=1 Tax=unclassified Sphingomonas TaxID=196159 RepID=UPI003CE767D4